MSQSTNFGKEEISSYFFYTLLFKVKIMSCIKKSYQTKKEARLFALYIKKKFKVVSKSYPCKKCGKIHLTTR